MLRMLRREKKAKGVVKAVAAKRLCALFLTLLAFVPLGMAGCSEPEVDEPCYYCHSSPSRSYRSAAGKLIYVCSSCSSMCSYCGGQATRECSTDYEVFFVCDSCYDLYVAG
ncbi:MAG TPA: hypothetical protein IAA58_12090 [Candidatus Gallacutalibacter stercoravium]|nr:hypothetical protein [Candidatus Gallacutalibacter stercoravium]